MDRSRMKGNLETILLAIIADEEPVYGLEIAREIAARTQGDLDLAPGSLYPPLHRLQKKGWVEVETRVSPHGSGHVSYYSITEAGRKGLAAEREDTRAFMRTLRTLLKL